MDQTRKVALVVGAQGVIGRNLVDHLLTLDDWEIIGLSRRGGGDSSGGQGTDGQGIGGQGTGNQETGEQSTDGRGTGGQRTGSQETGSPETGSQGTSSQATGGQSTDGRVDALASSDNKSGVGLSGRLRHIAVDLLDAEDSRRKLGGLREVTHIFYTAYQDRPSWAELVAPNLAMLVNVVEAVEPIAAGLRHISLMQGYKVYGAHLGPFKTPARESDPNHMPPEFNIDQQDFLEARQRGKRWTWSAIRPSVVGGFALGNPMNLTMVIAVYASISKELGLPLRFPGKPGAYDKLMEMTDAGLLAKATVWAATDERCANQAFNITNGDLFRWEDMWPRIARWFGLEVAPPLPMSLQVIMADKEPLWNGMMEKYGLKHDYKEVSSWIFGDFVFGWDYDMFGDGSKARRFGFHEFVDTEEMFKMIFEDFRKRKVIP